MSAWDRQINSAGDMLADDLVSKLDTLIWILNEIDYMLKALMNA